MASRVPLEARAAWSTSAARLTAVAVSVRDGHSIAFLGDSKGSLHKVGSSSWASAGLLRYVPACAVMPGTHHRNVSWERN